MPPAPPPAPGPVGALLAGGSSRRMGSDKALAVLGALPLFRWAAASLEGLPTRVQVGGAPLPGLGWRTLRDERRDAGPGGGIETALRAYPGAVVVVVGVDLPFVPVELLAAAHAALEPGVEAAVPRHGGRWHPLAAAWAPDALAALTAWLDAGRRDLQGFLDSRSSAVAALEGARLRALGDPERMLMNVNTPDDLEAARASVRC